MTTAAPILDMPALPAQYASNWHVLQVVREDARTGYCVAAADKAAPGVMRFTRDWSNAFDVASRAWSAANPMSPCWVSGKWPDGADTYPGADALAAVREILRDAA